MSIISGAIAGLADKGGDLDKQDGVDEVVKLKDVTIANLDTLGASVEFERELNIAKAAIKVAQEDLSKSPELETNILSAMRVAIGLAPDAEATGDDLTKLKWLAEELGIHLHADGTEILGDLDRNFDNEDFILTVEESMAFQEAINAKLLDPNYEVTHFEQDLLSLLPRIPDTVPEYVLVALIKMKLIPRGTTADQVKPAFKNFIEHELNEADFLKMKDRAALLKKEADINASILADSVNLNPAQLSVLRFDPTFNVPEKLAEAKRKAGGDETLVMTHFKSLVADHLFENRLKPWLNKNIDVVKKIHEGEKGSALDQFERKNLGVDRRGEVTSGIMDAAKGVSGLFIGDLKAAKYVSVAEDPVLGAIFDTDEKALPLLQEIERVAVHGGEHDETLDCGKDHIKAYVDRLFADETAETIAHDFTPFDAKALENDPNFLRFMTAKMQTVGSAWSGPEKPWEGKYEQYVFDTGYAALDFNQWLDSLGEDGPSPMERMWNDILSWLGNLMTVFTGKDENTDDDSKAREYKNKLEALKDAKKAEEDAEANTLTWKNADGELTPEGEGFQALVDSKLVDFGSDPMGTVKVEQYKEWAETLGAKDQELQKVLNFYENKADKEPISLAAWQIFIAYPGRVRMNSNNTGVEAKSSGFGLTEKYEPVGDKWSPELLDEIDSHNKLSEDQQLLRDMGLSEQQEAYILSADGMWHDWLMNDNPQYLAGASHSLLGLQNEKGRNNKDYNSDNYTITVEDVMNLAHYMNTKAGNQASLSFDNGKRGLDGVFGGDDHYWKVIGGELVEFDGGAAKKRGIPDDEKVPPTFEIPGASGEFASISAFFAYIKERHPYTP